MILIGKHKNFKESSLLLRTHFVRDLHLTLVKWEGSLTSVSNFGYRLHFYLAATSFSRPAQARLLDMWFKTDCSDCLCCGVHCLPTLYVGKNYVLF